MESNTHITPDVLGQVNYTVIRITARSSTLLTIAQRSKSGFIFSSALKCFSLIPKEVTKGLLMFAIGHQLESLLIICLVSLFFQSISYTFIGRLACGPSCDYKSPP